MKYLNAEQVLFIHARLIAETGGMHGVRDLPMLESALARPQSSFDGLDLYPTLFGKAAALLHLLINNHPFIDGNKRTGITAVGLFLNSNGCHLTASSKDLESFTLMVATSHLDIELLATWLDTHSQPN